MNSKYYNFILEDESLDNYKHWYYSVRDNNFKTHKHDAESTTYILPAFFNGKLRNSKAATKQFMELLRKCCESIGKRNGKTWGHVREALINIGLIDTYSAKMTLAQTIADICPNTTKSSVNQSMKRYYGKRDSVTDANIIADIAKQFQPVLDAIKP